MTIVRKWYMKTPKQKIRTNIQLTYASEVTPVNTDMNPQLVFTKEDVPLSKEQSQPPISLVAIELIEAAAKVAAIATNLIITKISFMQQHIDRKRDQKQLENKQKHTKVIKKNILSTHSNYLYSFSLFHLPLFIHY